MQQTTKTIRINVEQTCSASQSWMSEPSPAVPCIGSAHRLNSVSILSASKLTALILIILCSCSIILPWATAQSCNQRSIGTDTLNIAIIIYGPDYSLCSPTSNTCLNNDPVLMPKVPQIIFNYSHHFYATQHYQSWIMYEERLREFGVDGKLPLRGNSSIGVNITWFNVGPPSSPLILDRIQALAPRLATPKGQSPYLDSPHAFSFLIPPVIGDELHVFEFMHECEVTQDCIVIAPSVTSDFYWKCTDPLPPDCISAGKREGDRRHEYSLSTLWDPTQQIAVQLDLFKQYGLRTILILHQMESNDIADAVVDAAFIRGIQIEARWGLDSSNQAWNLNASDDQVATQCMEINPDAMIVLARADAFTLAPMINVLQTMQRRGFTPRSLVFGGGFEYYLQSNNLLNIDYTLGTIPSIPDLRGANYRAKTIPGVNFEVYSANDTNDSPQILKDAYLARWGIPPFGISGFVWPLIATHSILIAQKLTEQTMSDSVAALKDASYSISTPSVFTRILFDVIGRTGLTNEISVQHLPPRATDPPYSNIRVLTPAWIGNSFIFPMPTFDERVSRLGFFRYSSEQFLLAFTILAFLYLVGWMIFLIRHYDQPLIRIAIPQFMVLVIIGCMIFLSSNVINTLHVSYFTCNLTPWLWSVGFSLCFASLLAKAWRIHAIWKSQLRTTTESYQKKLMAFVAVMCLIDVFLNLFGNAYSPRQADLVVPDPDRPKYNFTQCSKNSVYNAILLVHLVEKASLVLAGMVLTYRIRNVSQQFNESYLLAACIYNFAIFTALILPILQFLDNKTRNDEQVAQANGTVMSDSMPTRQLYMQIQGYSIILIAASTVTFLLVPKYLLIRNAVKNLNSEAVNTLGLGVNRTHHASLELAKMTPNCRQLHYLARMSEEMEYQRNNVVNGRPLAAESLACLRQRSAHSHATIITNYDLRGSTNSLADAASQAVILRLSPSSPDGQHLQYSKSTQVGRGSATTATTPRSLIEIKQSIPGVVNKSGLNSHGTDDSGGARQAADATTASHSSISRGTPASVSSDSASATPHVNPVAIHIPSAPNATSSLLPRTDDAVEHSLSRSVSGVSLLRPSQSSFTAGLSQSATNESSALATSAGRQSPHGSSVIAAAVLAAFSPQTNGSQASAPAFSLFGASSGIHSFSSASSSQTSMSRKLRMSRRQLHLLHITPDTPNISVEDETSVAPVGDSLSAPSAVDERSYIAIGSGSLAPVSSNSATIAAALVAASSPTHSLSPSPTSSVAILGATSLLPATTSVAGANGLPDLFPIAPLHRRLPAIPAHLKRRSATAGVVGIATSANLSLIPEQSSDSTSARDTVVQQSSIDVTGLASPSISTPLDAITSTPITTPGSSVSAVLPIDNSSAFIPTVAELGSSEDTDELVVMPVVHEENPLDGSNVVAAPPTQSVDSTPAKPVSDRHMPTRSEIDEALDTLARAGWKIAR